MGNIWIRTCKRRKECGRELKQDKAFLKVEDVTDGMRKSRTVPAKELSVRVDHQRWRLTSVKNSLVGFYVGEDDI